MDSLSVTHSFYTQVAGKFSSSKDFRKSILAYSPFTHKAFCFCNFCFNFATETGSRELYCLNDFVVAGTAAVISVYCSLYFFFSRIKIYIQQRLCTDDHSGSTKATLNGSRCCKCIRVDFLFFFRKPFNSQNFFTISLCRTYNAGLIFFSIHQNCTGAACSNSTTIFHAGNIQIITQKIKDVFIFLCADFFSVNFKCIHSDLPLLSDYKATSNAANFSVFKSNSTVYHHLFYSFRELLGLGISSFINYCFFIKQN